MIPTTNALLICVVFLCGLEETVLSQRGHCSGNLCVALFQKPENFLGAQKSCKVLDGQLFVLSLGHLERILKSLPSGLSGSYWLELPSTAWETKKAAAGIQNCSSISASSGRTVTVLWEPCSKNLDGFLCQNTFSETCGGLQADGGAQVKYIAHLGFEVEDSDRFPLGTIAVAEKTGSKYPDSKHVCFLGWTRAPWSCEVLNGGCEDGCNPGTQTCTCPEGQSLHPNNISCTTDPCANCAHGCQPEGDTYVCKCVRGYRLAQDGGRCVDVDECKEENPCTGEEEECENTQGGFECMCRDGFVEDDGVCVDAAICERCEHMLCDKVSGVYECACRSGFRVSDKDATKCEQHCTERDCPAVCIPDPDNDKKGEPQCFCPDGYITDINNSTPFCTDINECENEKQCDHVCENLFGGYRCLCRDGFELHDEYMCIPAEEEDDESGSTPPNPTPASAHPAAVPSYVKTGSVLGIAVFAALCAVLLFVLIRNGIRRCGRFELSSFKHPDIDIFYLQQVTTETYKRLSFDKQFKNDALTPKPHL